MADGQCVERSFNQHAVIYDIFVRVRISDMPLLATQHAACQQPAENWLLMSMPRSHMAPEENRAVRTAVLASF